MAQKIKCSRCGTLTQKNMYYDADYGYICTRCYNRLNYVESHPRKLGTFEKVASTSFRKSLEKASRYK
jgi:recombinational DNA repair protein (RecF pathway)